MAPLPCYCVLSITIHLFVVHIYWILDRCSYNHNNQFSNKTSVLNNFSKHRDIKGKRHICHNTMPAQKERIFQTWCDIWQQLSNMFWPTWAIDLFAKNVAIMGIMWICGPVCPGMPYLEMSNRVLKTVEARFPVTHGIMGTLSLKSVRLLPTSRLCTHTCQRPLVVETVLTQKKIHHHSHLKNKLEKTPW